MSELKEVNHHLLISEELELTRLLVQKLKDIPLDQALIQVTRHD